MKYSESPSLTICFSSGIAAAASIITPSAAAIGAGILGLDIAAFATDRRSSLRRSPPSAATSSMRTCASWAIFSTRLIVPTTRRTCASSYSSPLLFVTRTNPSKARLLSAASLTST